VLKEALDFLFPACNRRRNFREILVIAKCMGTFRVSYIERHMNAVFPRWAKAGVPIALIALTAGALWLAGLGTATSDKLKEGVTYAVWIQEAEVTPRKVDGTDWGSDSKAPDLSAMIAWQDHIVLRTVVAHETLIGCWDPLAVDVKSVIHGEMGTSSVQRVARVRLAKGQPLLIGVFDEYLLRRNFVGGLRIPLESLRLGTNEVTSSGTLRRVQIMVADEPDQVARVKGKAPYAATGDIVWLKEPPAVMAGATAGPVNQAKAAVQEISDKVETELRKTGEMLDETTKALQGKTGAAKKWIEKAFSDNP